MIRKHFYYILTIVFCLLFVESCRVASHFRHSYSDVNSLLHETKNLKEKPYLKAHLKNGEVYIFTVWKIDTTLNIINGTGTKYNFNRNKSEDGELSLAISDVVIFETNKVLKNTENGRKLLWPFLQVSIW